jgi:hypothetical protein
MNREFKMQKLILCSVVALAMSTGGVLAKTETVTITIDGACDAFSITVRGENVGLTENNPVCDLAIGSGYIGTVKRYGRYAIVGAILNNDVTAHWVIGLQYPLVTGGSYTVGYTTDGIHIRNKRGSGTYTVSGTAAQGPHGTKSITSEIRK